MMFIIPFCRSVLSLVYFILLSLTLLLEPITSFAEPSPSPDQSQNTTSTESETSEQIKGKEEKKEGAEEEDDFLDGPIGPDFFDEDTSPTPKTSTPQPSSDKKVDPKPAEDDDGSRDAVLLDKVSIIGDAERVSRVSGSAHQVKEEELEEQNYDDVHRVLKQVPGVYVRDEDGLGLRPNIGLRGANSDRSAKITLMEDGVLMAPAPYSAPAAYYFPLTTRLTTVEVFKGPASIQYGPNTIGGALNMVTRSAPTSGHQGAIDGSWGQYGTGKLHAYYGWGQEHFGILIEGIQLQSDGFKELDGGGDTGFLKREAMLKFRLNSDPNAHFFQQLRVKLGWASEVSNETYLGLSDEDFTATPFRRYAASQLAEMSWVRLQGKLDYEIAVGDDWDLTLTAYRHQFERGWEKIIGFTNPAISLEDVLANPDSQRNLPFYEILTGQKSSIGSNEDLFLGLNDRSYLSQGLQLSTHWRLRGDGWANQLQVGARLHGDHIERDHSERRAAMTEGKLIPQGERRSTLQNRGETLALSAFVFDEVRLGQRFRLTPGVRVERYRTKLTDQSTPSGEVIKGSDWTLLPGVGAWVTLSDHWGILGGVHRGFAPLTLSQTGQSDPEVSINYELGTRWEYPSIRGEFIAFYNDYQNLVGTCTQSSGCPIDQIDQQFNAGSAQVIGLEWVLSGEQSLSTWGIFDQTLTYTYTRGRFNDDFRSGFAQWGEVSAGDALPYVPEHQLNVKIGLSDSKRRYGGGVSYTFVSTMLDAAGVAGQGNVAEVPAQHVLDAYLYAEAVENLRVYLTVDNVLNQSYQASRRPFGLRPGKPLLIQLGARYSF